MTYYVGFDTETDLIAPGRQVPDAVCLSWAMREYGTRGAVKKGLLDPERADLWFEDRLRDPECILVAHNAAFDVAVMLERNPHLLPLVFQAYEEGRIICTMVHSILDYIGRSTWTQKVFNLAHVAKKLLGRDRSAQKHGPDAWRFYYSELRGIPLALWPQAAVDYAIQDAEDALLVQEAIRDSQKTSPAERGSNWPDLHNQCRADWVMHLMRCWGVRTDPVLVPRVAEPLRSAVAQLLERLETKGIYSRQSNGRFKMNQKYVQDRVLRAFNGDPPLTDGGKKGIPSVSISKDTLRISGDDDLELLAELSGPMKTVTAFLKAVEQGTKEPLHPYWNVLVNSGRTSCKAPNLQNQPTAPGIRETFIARKGNVLVQADYNAAEMRTLAQGLLNRIGDNALARLYQTDRYADAHLQVVSTSLQIPYSEAYKRHKAGDPLTKLHRDMAKIANFGYAGGMSYMSLPAYALGMGVKSIMGVDLHVDVHGEPSMDSVRVSQEARDIWLRTYPEMEEYFRAQKSAATYEEPLVQDWSGRVRARGSEGRGLGYCDRCNSVFQGLAADGIKQAAWAITKEALLDRSSPLYSGHLYALVHDEVIFEAPEEAAPEAAERMAKLMEEGMSVVAPDVPHWAEPCVMGKRWIKGAKDVRDANGRMVRYDTHPEHKERWRKALTTRKSNVLEERWGITIPTIRLPSDAEWTEALENVT